MRGTIKAVFVYDMLTLVGMAQESVMGGIERSKLRSMLLLATWMR
ncbi:hypothetical protein [Paraeggerthella sp. Marseille-Q4926]|nr:hypothetical protein [Paraeggerthella sp. Marseille-Q4926]